MSHKARRHSRSQKTKEWAPRSPDLTVCDFYLFGRVKSLVYAHPRPQTLDELKEKIREVMRSLDPTEIRAAFQSMRLRAHACLSVQGNHFKKRDIPHFWRCISAVHFIFYSSKLNSYLQTFPYLRYFPCSNRTWTRSSGRWWGSSDYLPACHSSQS